MDTSNLPDSDGPWGTCVALTAGTLQCAWAGTPRKGVAPDETSRHLQLSLSRNRRLARTILQALPPLVWISPADRVYLIGFDQLTSVLVRSLPPDEPVHCVRIICTTPPSALDWEMLALLGKAIGPDVEIAAWLLSSDHWGLWTNPYNPTPTGKELGQHFRKRQEAGRMLKAVADARISERATDEARPPRAHPVEGELE